MLKGLVHEETEWLSVRGCDGLTNDSLVFILNHCAALQHLDIQECHGMGKGHLEVDDVVVGQHLRWFNMKRVRGIDVTGLGIHWSTPLTGINLCASRGLQSTSAAQQLLDDAPMLKWLDGFGCHGVDKSELDLTRNPVLLFVRFGSDVMNWMD
eukprot:TRINITY_DN23631_c0_g1_i1.p2 TRINITY_DN23631_c0_g1~~TRINITY_DN23631_c0_g1_i1.p2  ORF type:complete len:153 (+),score=33.95 TRINITY_DN23631_c0_g1_i1:300-758(+)